MSKRASRGRVKNPCRICEQTVANKSGVQCKGACARWAHYKCLGYSPQKILDIRDGVIKITCPCPHCNPKVPVEEAGKNVREFFPNQLPLGDAKCPPDAPCQSPRKQSPSQSPRKPSPCDLNLPHHPGSPTRKAGSPCQELGDLEAHCQLTEEDSKFRRPSPKRSFIKPQDDFAFKPTSYEPQLFQSSSYKQGDDPCAPDAPCQSKRKQSPCQSPLLPSLNDLKNLIGLSGSDSKKGKKEEGERKEKPSSQETGDSEAPHQPTFPKPCPKRSLLKPQDDYAFAPTCFEPKLFQSSSFKANPPQSNVEVKDQQGVTGGPGSPRLRSLPKGKHGKKDSNDIKTPPLSRTPSKISLVSPEVSPKQSKEACPISCKTPSASIIPLKSRNANVSSKVSLKKNDQCNKPITPKMSFSKPSQKPPPCKKTAPCQQPPPDTSLSCCKKCKNCKCSSSLSLVKSNCVSPICPSKFLAKTPPKAPPPSLKSAPCAHKTISLCVECTSSTCPQIEVPTTPPKSTSSSEKKPCVNCTSSTCPNQKGGPNLRSVETCTEKKSKSCACLTVLRESRMRQAVSDSRMTNTCQTMLFSAINQLCNTVGQLSGQIKMLMSKMRVNG